MMQAIMEYDKYREQKYRLTKDLTTTKPMDDKRSFQSDNIGPFRISSTNGSKYFAILVDVNENLTYYELNNNETEVPAKFIKNTLAHFL